MTKVIGIIATIMIFSVIIIFHEVGHLILAKKNNILVEEFMVGFGPKLCSFKIGETVYSIRLILLGGACKMLGMDDDTHSERAFSSKSLGVRFSVMLAGPVFNFILAYVVAVIIMGAMGYDPCIVTSVDKGSAIYEAGLLPGDTITSYDGQNITLGRELSLYEYLNGTTGREIRFSYERDGVEYDAVYTPDEVRGYKLGFTYMANDEPAKVTDLVTGSVFHNAGVQPGDVIVAVDGVELATGLDFYNYVSKHPFDDTERVFTFERAGKTRDITLVPEYTVSYDTGFSYNVSYRVKTTPVNVLKYSFVEIGYWIKTVVKGFGRLFTGQLRSDEYGGVIRMTSAVTDLVEETKSEGGFIVLMNLLNYTILFSANLGVANLFPIPGLDGGKILFLIIEAIRRKPVPPEKEGLVTLVGCLVLLLLAVIIMFRDINYLFF